MLKQAEAKFSSFITLPKLPDFSILCDSSEIPFPRSFDVYSPNKHSDETGPDDSNDGEGISTADDSSGDSDVPESSEDKKEMSTLVNSTETQNDAEVIAAVSSADHERTPEPIAKSI